MEQENAYIQFTTDPFQEGWLECSSCYRLLFYKNNLPKVIPNICPKCLAPLELADDIGIEKLSITEEEV